MDRRGRAIEVMLSTLKDCPFGCLGGDCGVEWEIELKPCPVCTPLMKAESILSGESETT